MTETLDLKAATADEPPLDRAISPIAGRLSAGRAGRALVVAALFGGCAVFALATWQAERPRSEPLPEQPARQVVAFEPAKPPVATLASPGSGAPSLSVTPGAETGAVPAISSDASAPPSGTAQGQAEAARAIAVRNIRASPLLAYSRPGGAGPASSLVPALAASLEQTPTELDQLRRGSALAQTQAYRLADRSFLILAGTTIPCVLQTAMDSATAGYVTCGIPTDVYSDNGAVVLMEKGTRVLGEYRSGMRQGQRRLFVLWTRAVTPNGVAIALASPATDALGRAGFDGDLDTHFWDRFGAALLLSVVDSGAYAATSRNDGSGVTRLPSDAAGIALQGSAAVPPTLRKPQGAEVAILAAQDFDFSTVYGLRDRRP